MVFLKGVNKMEFVFDDGGRKASGYKGFTGDCGVRAIAIATKRPYKEIYLAINEACKSEKLKKRMKSKSSARTGIHKHTFKKFMESIGWRWVPTMFIGQGCKIHVKASELPTGNIILALSKHYTAVIDGVLHDTYDCSRNETRCVYGYYIEN